MDIYKLIHLAPSSRYERLHPGHRRLPVDKRTPTRSDIAYTSSQRATMAAHIDTHPEWTINQIYYDLVDRGEQIASLRTYYRIAASPLCLTRHPACASPRKHHRPSTQPPQLVAQRPYETIVWDITMLPLKYRGQMVALHMGLDLYSRAIVGYQLDTTARAATAVKMFNTIIADASKDGYTIKVVHADNGSTMKSEALTKLFAAHSIEMSHSRPHVSDDNPHMESSFSTLKQDMTYPGVFDDFDEAMAWVDGWVKFYNMRRYHPGLANFTPHQVLTGRWQHVWDTRVKSRQAHYDAHPARYRYQPPTVAKPDPVVRFNVTNTPGDVTNRKVSQVMTNT